MSCCLVGFLDCLLMGWANFDWMDLQDCHFAGKSNDLLSVPSSSCLFNFLAGMCQFPYVSCSSATKLGSFVGCKNLRFSKPSASKLAPRETLGRFRRTWERSSDDWGDFRSSLAFLATMAISNCQNKHLGVDHEECSKKCSQKLKYRWF